VAVAVQMLLYFNFFFSIVYFGMYIAVWNWKSQRQVPHFMRVGRYLINLPRQHTSLLL
jgi:hypothetical protein